MTATTKTDRVSAEMLEMALLLSKHKVLSAQDLGQIKALCSPPPVYLPERVAQIRIQKAKMSQTVFAGFLNVRPSTVQKWESPASGKHPGGAAAKLLQLIEKKGIEALAV
ncbi:DNA-binding transcriptional regulator [Limnohabitans sp. DM1]|uniref:helix-turn-helix domain-containing protein n=1 Tax=Limnohabitans sp. DM1 TaxID=1597955 RepID=UPI000B141586|nr:transcriptional regulator [Limnohabitans sp. DM1]